MPDNALARPLPSVGKIELTADTRKQRLQQHIHMAEQAGADITTLYGDDISQQIAEFARISGITKIVLGRSSVHRRHFWSGPSLTEKLTLTAPNLDIYIYFIGE